MTSSYKKRQNEVFNIALDVIGKTTGTLRPEDEDGNDNENKLGWTVFGCRFNFEHAIVKKGEHKQVKYFHFQLQTGKKSEAQNQILLAHADNLITDEEFVLLYDMNRSKNLELPYRNYLNFDLDAMSDDECWSEFRFYKGDIFRIIDVLHHLPDHFTCYNGSVFEREESMCIFLKRFAYPCRYQDLIFRFARAPPLPCMISNQVMNFLYENWN